MAATLIPRNDYYEMIRTTGKILKEDEYDILPLDLRKYHLSETTQRIANANFMEETENRYGDYMLSGHWLSDLSWQFAQKCDFEYHQPNAYNAFAFSDEQMAVFTYCEGDICLTPYTDKESYEKEKQETIEFYKEQYSYEI